MRRRTLLLAAPLAAVAQPALRVFGPTQELDHRYDFPLRLLRLLLAAAGFNAEPQPQPHASQASMLPALRAGELDIGLFASVGPFPADVLPLRFPIRRGLLGARLLLARRADAPHLARLNDASALQGLRLGYGRGWADRAQFEALGQRLLLVDGYPELFRALARGDCDLLHRGVNEIWGELDHPLLVPHGVVVVPQVALSYPVDDYFCLPERHRDWLPRLQHGAELLWRSRAYHRVFFEAFGRSIERAGFARRRVLPVVGYGTEPATPLRSFDALRLRPGRLEARP